MPDSLSGRLSPLDVARQFTRPQEPGDFDRMACALRAFQKANCSVYARFDHTYLPIAAFKHATVACFDPEEAAKVFRSSGTSGHAPSLHYVRDLEFYERAIRTHFLTVFGAGPFTLKAHLPGYAADSSLVYMLQRLIKWFGDSESGFFLDDLQVLERAIRHSTANKTQLLLFGAAFGLLSLVEARQWALPPSGRIVETGGMKTHRRSVTRSELHALLAQGFDIRREQVWSEFGMCELLSQAYARGSSVYFPPPWMRVSVFDPERIEQPLPAGQVGVLGVIDLANVYTVSAIMTEDLGVQRGGGFEVVGRLRQSELRGCNFLLDDV